MKLGYNRSQREKLIAENSKQPPHRGTHRVEVAGKQLNLPIFSVSIEAPKYRLRNGRTLSAQEEYVADHKKSADFFTKADDESNLMQEIQHGLLKQKITKTDKVNIIKEFKTVEQTEPLLLTVDGFVLNGNRRLCAMREVYYSDKKKFKHFKNIEVVALPFQEEKQLQDIEATLQLKTDWQQDYTWIDRALIYKSQTEIGGLSTKEIAGRDGVSRKMVDETIALIPSINEYLAWIGTPKKYSEISDQEHSFRRILQNWTKLKKPGEKDLLQNVTFQLIKNDHKGRTYTMVPDLQKHMSELIGKLAHELGEKSDDLKKLNNAVKSTSKPTGGKVVDVAIEVIESNATKRKSTKKKNACIDAIRSANSALKAAMLHKSNSSHLKGLDEQLAQIEDSLQKIKLW